MYNHCSIKKERKINISTNIEKLDTFVQSQTHPDIYIQAWQSTSSNI